MLGVENFGSTQPEIIIYNLSCQLNQPKNMNWVENVSQSNLFTPIDKINIIVGHKDAAYALIPNDKAV